MPGNKPVVYLLTCVATGKQYVGIAKCGADKRFRKHCTEAAKGSLLFLHKAIRKYGPSNFVLNIICFVDTWDAAKDAERRYIVEYGTFNPSGFNMTSGGEGTVDYKHTDAAKAAMSGKHMGKIISAETRSRISAANKGLVRSEETKARMSMAFTGHEVSESTRQKLSDSLRVALNRPEVKEKMIASNKRRKGIPQTPESIAIRLPFIRAAMTVASVRAKIVASNKRRVYSEETLQKMSRSLRVALADPAVKAKMAASNAARVWTPEMRANMSAAVTKAKQARRQSAVMEG